MKTEVLEYTITDKFENKRETNKIIEHVAREWKNLFKNRLVTIEVIKLQYFSPSYLFIYLHFFYKEKRRLFHANFLGKKNILTW